MPVSRDPLSSTKGRPVPVDPDATIVRSPNEDAVLQSILKELTAIRTILSNSFNIDIKPEDF